MQVTLVPHRIIGLIPPAFRSIGNWFRSDARHYQIIFQLLFLIYGMFALHWDIPLLRLNFIVLTCIGVQTLFVLFKTNNWGSLKSALITALGLSLLLQSNSLEIYFIAAVVAICGKFIFRFRGKHIFNPANFGIITVLLFTNDAWVSPGQWGSNALLLMLVGCLGLIVLLRVKRLDTAFTFLFVFLGLHCIRNVFYLGWPADFFFHQLTTGSLLLFTFFMITDPMTTPSSKTARIIWASLVGVLAWWLSTKQFIHTAPLWALIALSPLVPLLDAFFPAQKFIWNH